MPREKKELAEQIIPKLRAILCGRLQKGPKLPEKDGSELLFCRKISGFHENVT
jgi:hypothetical protein